MPSVTINSYVFERQNSSLIHLAGAIKDIGWRVQALTNNLPVSCKAQVAEQLDRELMAIDSTCHCLGEVALAASNEAEEWAMWAERTDTNLTYHPHSELVEERPRVVAPQQSAGELQNLEAGQVPVSGADPHEKVTVEKIGRIIKETFEAGYSEEDGKVLSDILQEIYARIHPNAMNPAHLDLE